MTSSLTTHKMTTLPTLKAGDRVKIIAPASRCSDQQLANLQKLLISWDLNCQFDSDIFGEDVLCANTDQYRLQSLQQALEDPQVKGIICARGGYGSMRIIPGLNKLIKPNAIKLFLGMSDITALNLFFMQKWQWPILHASLSVDKFSFESIASVKNILFNADKAMHFSLQPLNVLAQKNQHVQSTITGGNLCLVQTSIGTIWQMNAKNKIIFLEEIDERGYRVDRMLEQLHQAGLFKEAKAIIFGDFIQGDEANGKNLIVRVLQRFADNCPLPVLKLIGIGHDYINFPLPMGTPAQLQLGTQPQLNLI